MEFFMVGGAVRDEIMGVPSKDIDFTCVLSPEDSRKTKAGAEHRPFFVMKAELERRGFRIFQEQEKFLTIRAQFPKASDPRANIHAAHKGLTADFVLARKDGVSTDGRRPDSVEPGTLLDDLARRDFTMNAIAKDIDGNFIDPFGGQTDIADRLIRCVGSAEDRLREDALRGLRALRFSVTKGFKIDHEIRWVLTRGWFADALASVSKERQREEMEKMFAHDTGRALSIISDDQLWRLREAVFSDGLRLSATMKG